MPIKQGDKLILTRNGREMQVVAISNEDGKDHSVQVSHKGATFTASTYDLTPTDKGASDSP